MKDFIDKTTGQSGTPINRSNMMAIQDYINETVVFSSNSITKTNSNNEVETITFGTNEIVKQFTADGHTISQTITFTPTGYRKELS